MVTGKGTIGGFPVIAIMDSTFRMGSMGSVVGEKSRLQLKKQKRKKSVYHLYRFRRRTYAGGVLSLMQMAKTSSALKLFSEEQGLIISVMTHPTTGGVSPVSRLSVIIISLNRAP